MSDAQRHGFSSRAQYAQARREELAAALRLIGLGAEHCAEVKIPDQEAHLHLRELLERLREMTETFRPTLVLSPAYEGGHPDHDSAAFAVATVRAACGFAHWEFPLYHSDAAGHMIPAHYLTKPGGRTLRLSRPEQALKRTMLRCFSTQQEILSRFPTRLERFRTAPEYNFSKAPHPGALLYERWGWGITGKAWRECARKALGL